MPARRNPFTPTFGIVPAHLAGRASLLDEMSQAFRNGLGDPNLSSILIGARGCGKTALLSCIADEARRNGWVSATVVAAPGMLEDILQQALEASAEFVDPRGRRQLTGINVAQLVGIEWTLQPETPANWRSRMNAVLDQLAQRDIGLLICVDEVNVSVDEMVQLAATYQLFVSEGREVSLVMAGLSKNTTDLVEDDRISFLRRSRQRRLGAIPDIDVEDALMRTVEDGGKAIEDHALERMVEACGGFAYMVQLVGYCTWVASGSEATINLGHAIRGVQRAQDEFEAGVLATTYREMSRGDRAFAQAMLADSSGSALSDVATRMGKGTNYTSTYKTRLMKQGIIAERSGKTFDFDIPGFRQFLEKQMLEG